MKKIFLSVAVMLSAATMSVNAMSPVNGYDNNTTFSQYNSADDLDGKDGQEVVDIDDATCDWQAKSRFFMFALDRYIADNPDAKDCSDMIQIRNSFKDCYDTNNVEFLKLFCVVIWKNYPEIIANAKAELQLGR